MWTIIEPASRQGKEFWNDPASALWYVSKRTDQIIADRDSKADAEVEKRLGKGGAEAGLGKLPKG